MSSLFKIVAITSPALALLIYLAVVYMHKTEIRYDLQNQYIQQQTREFDQDFAHFFDKKYWQEKEKQQKEQQAVEAKMQKELEEERKKTARMEKEMEEVMPLAAKEKGQPEPQMPFSIPDKGENKKGKVNK